MKNKMPVKDCPQCDGVGWYRDTEPGHDSMCDGSCRNCPVPVEVQIQCLCEETGIDSSETGTT